MSKRVWQYPEVTSIAADDYLLLDNETDGSKSILASKVGAILINKVVTERKVYKASEETGVVNGYKEVSVEVPYTTITDLEGDIVTFDDGEDFPMPSLKVGIEPIQEGSGDPSPTNIRPISGHTEANVTRCGKNLFDISAENTSVFGNLVYSVNVDNGTITLTGKGGGQSIILFNRPLTAGEYIASFTVNNYTNRFFIRCFNANGDILTDSDLTIAGLTWNKYYQGFYGIAPQSFIIPNNVSYFYPAIGVNDEKMGDQIVISNIQLELGSTATEYEPYNGQTYTIQFKDGDNPLTVYGGSLDVVSGELVVDRVGIKGVNVVRVGATGSGVNYADTTNIYPDLVQNTTTISDRYVQIDTSQSGKSGEFRTYNGEFTIYDDRFTDTTTAQSLLNDVEFCYELATPQTYQLTPTQVNSLLGSNNVWADCGKSLVSYQKTWTPPDFTPEN